MKIVLLTDTEHDDLAENFKYLMKLTDQEPVIHVWSLSAMNSLLPADYVFIDGGALRGQTDEFLDRTNSFMRGAIERNPSSLFIVTGGLNYSYYDAFFKEVSDLPNVTYWALSDLVWMFENSLKERFNR